jgi:5-methylcytosine-specific restriction endonuclease McrBC GTP-binding regulatory subunit McrB
MSPGAEEESAAGEGDSEVELPAELEIPANVSFVGTVNIDETTHPFSPKVLDRANVIEFSEVDVERALGHGDEAEGGGLRLLNGSFDAAWLCASKDDSTAPKSVAHQIGEFTGALEDVHGTLAWSNLHFGYRVIDEVSAFVGHALEKTGGDPEEIVRRAFDLQIRQKIIPKLSGGRELEEPLAQLLSYCLDGERRKAIDVESVRSKARGQLESTEAPTSQPKYPGAARKLLRMLDRLADTGFIGALE